MPRLLTLLCLSLIAAACTPTPEKQTNEAVADLKAFEWLQGTWMKDSKNGQLFETWTKTNDSLFSGMSFMIAKGDTVFSEKIRLQLKDGAIFYIPTVSDQNEGQPVPFRLVADTNGVFIFENKEHDFPQRILYSNPAPDSLHAQIEGSENGVFRKQEFPMTKKK